MVVLKFKTRNNLGALALILNALKKVPQVDKEDKGINIVYSRVVVHKDGKSGDIEITVNDYDRERTIVTLRELAESSPELKLCPTGMVYRVTFSISDEPGALLEVSEVLAQEQINIAVCCGPEPGSTKDAAIMVLEFDCKKCCEEEYNKAKSLISSVATVINESPFVPPSL